MKNVLVVGADMTNNGGIASVVKTLYKESLDNLDYFGINYILLKTGLYKDGNKFLNVFTLFLALTKYCYIVLSRSIDIVHIHTSHGFSFYRKTVFIILSKLFAKNIVLHFHASSFIEFFIPTNSIKKLIFGNVLKIPNANIVLCNEWKNALENNYDINNVIIIPNPISNSDPNRILRNNSNCDLNVLFVGFLIKTKGVIDLLEVAKNLEDEKIFFTIAGKGELQGQITSAKLRNVKYVGWANEINKRSLLENNDVLFLPSYKEGMPISILEGMNSGLAIISTKIAGIPDVVREGRNGYLFKPGDINGMSEAFRKLNNNKKKLQEIKNNNLIDIEKYNVKLILTQIKDLYDRLVVTK